MSDLTTENQERSLAARVEALERVVAEFQAREVARREEEARRLAVLRAQVAGWFAKKPQAQQDPGVQVIHVAGSPYGGPR